MAEFVPDRKIVAGPCFIGVGNCDWPLNDWRLRLCGRMALRFTFSLRRKLLPFSVPIDRMVINLMKDSHQLLFRAMFAVLVIQSAIQCLAMDSLLIDDFSVEQTGFVTGELAAFDLLTDSRLFGGSREIWGGGSFSCPGCSIGAMVQSGVFAIEKTPSSYAGTGNVTWPSLHSTTTLDISDFSLIQLDIEHLVGSINSRITIVDDTVAEGKSVLNVLLTHNGSHSFRIPVGVDKSRVRHITISSLVENGEEFQMSSVQLVVPEPSTATLVVASALLFAFFRYIDAH